MFRQDYIKRQIELFAEALAKLVARRKGGEPAAALAEARTAYRALGVDPALLDLDARTVVRIVGDREKLESLCALLEELASAHDALQPGPTPSVSGEALRAQATALRSAADSEASTR